jgi:hypothetical protein
MLNQWWVSLEQETERKCANSLEAHRADFRAKTDAALERYKQGREALERQVRDLEAELRRAHEARRGIERALEQADAAMNALQRETSWIGEENEAMVQQIMGLTKELQEDKDTEEEARLLRHGGSAAHRHRGPEPAPAPEDDGAILRFFYQLSDKLVEAAARVTELINAECRELLGLAGTRIFSNLQHLCPDLDLLDVLQRRATTTPGTPERLDIAIQCLQAIYSRPGAPVWAEHLSLPLTSGR